MQISITEQLKAFSGQLITHQLLKSILRDYKRPNDKISELQKAGILQPLKKGIYIAGPSLGGTRLPEPLLIANHLLGPSYVSTETALSYYGLIPERVYEITSMTTKASRKFKTSVGTFGYIKLSLPYYAFGISQATLTEDQNVLIASREKALSDKVVTTPGVILRSKKDVMSYLLEDLRMDEESLKKFKTEEMETWLADAPKQNSLSILINTIRTL